MMVLADPWAAILVTVGQTQISVSSVLKSILIIEMNHTRHLKHLERLSRPHLAKNLHFRGLTFGRKIKLMECNRLGR